MRKYRFLIDFADNDRQHVIKRYYLFAADLFARIEGDVEWASSFFELFQYVFAMHRMTPVMPIICQIEFILFRKKTVYT